MSAANGPLREQRGRLTGRERSIVALIANGKETREIGATLHISPETVRTHVRNAMSKLGAHTRAQLVALVIGSQTEARPPDAPGSEKSPVWGIAEDATGADD